MDEKGEKIGRSAILIAILGLVFFCACIGFAAPRWLASERAVGIDYGMGYIAYTGAIVMIGVGIIVWAQGHFNLDFVPLLVVGFLWFLGVSFLGMANGLPLFDLPEDFQPAPAIICFTPGLLFTFLSLILLRSEFKEVQEERRTKGVWDESDWLKAEENESDSAESLASSPVRILLLLLTISIIFTVIYDIWVWSKF